MAASALALVAVRVSVLGIFSPAAVTLAAGGTRHVIAAHGETLTVDGAARDRLRVEGSPDVVVTVLEHGRPRITRRFHGAIEARPAGAAIALIDDLPDEDYLPGTVALEARGDRSEAQKAQAVLARTFVARGSRHPGTGWDLCDLTHCQTYRGADGETEAARAAVAATRGQVLTVGGKVADVYFTAACGGATADAADVWPEAAVTSGSSARPWLRSVVCEGCRDSPDHAWRGDFSLAELDVALAGEGRLTGLTVIDRGAGGVVRRIRLEGLGRSLTGEQFRLALGRTLGWSAVKSNRFTVEKRGARLHFEGRGFGHGVGLCEAGAAEQARHGASYREILGHYFPGAEIGATPPRLR